MVKLLWTLDFAENYAFVVQDAPPGFHWNNNQATVFVAYIYYKDGGEVKGKGFVVISDNLSHDTIAVFTYQKLLIDYLKNNFSVNKINYLVMVLLSNSKITKIFWIFIIIIMTLE